LYPSGSIYANDITEQEKQKIIDENPTLFKNSKGDMLLPKDFFGVSIKSNGSRVKANLLKMTINNNKKIGIKPAMFGEGRDIKDKLDFVRCLLALPGTLRGGKTRKHKKSKKSKKTRKH
jgi:hypothetical protein